MRKHYKKQRSLLISICLSLIFTSCVQQHEKLIDESVFYAVREGVANCMSYLCFQENGQVIQKNYCFGVATEYGKYEKNEDSLKIYWKENSQTSDNTICNIATIEKFKDKVGHTYKKMYYYLDKDSMTYRIEYDVFDSETKCVEYNTTEDNSDLTFLSKRLSKDEVLEYENTLNSNSKNCYFTLSKDYYPNEQNLILSLPIVFERNYTIGIPLETSYQFYNDTLMVQYHEWSDAGVKCKENFDKNAYREIYKQLMARIIEIKGNPVEFVGDLDDTRLTQFERIWDNEDEHIELHLYFYDNYRIRLINYWK